MDLDSPNDSISRLNHKYLINGRFRGVPGDMQLQTIPGNILIPNEFLPTEGDNQNNGGFFDAIKQRIIWWNYNSEGNHGIYIYSTKNEKLSKLFLCGTDSADDILNLNLNFPVHSAAIVYRTEGDGDLLYWTDGYNRPRYINMDTVADLVPFTEDMINAAKNVPLTPLVCSYQSDVNVNVNNLRKKLFRFAQRWVYKNLEKSTISPLSKVPIPVNGYDPDTQNDATNNNNILVPIYGGGDDYQKIELLVQFNEGNVWGDLQSVAIFDRDDYSINPGATYNFNFFNDGIYPVIDPADATLYWDRIPDKANALEVLNGNHIIYAGTTDGYNGLSREDIDVTLTTGLTALNIASIAYNYTGGSYIIVNIGPVITTGIAYHIQFDYVSGGVPGSVSFDYITPAGATLASIAVAMASGITSGLITGIYSSPGVFQVDVSGTGVILSNIIVNTDTNGIENATPAFKWSCPERFGLQYLDQWDKPVGGVYSFVSDSALDITDFLVTTLGFDVVSNTPQIPFIAATINHTPPEGATCYHWVRAELTPKFIHWVTNDYQTDTDFLYICIQNLTYQGTQNSGFVPSYDFAKGDRVRVMAAYDSASGVLTPYNIQLDFEILGVIDRTMTSPAVDGRFLKVAKPATLPSAPYQAKMFIEIYTPSALVPSTELVFKEWGEKYDIYEVGGNRYHRGQFEDQTDLQAATFNWVDGDVYYKNRTFYLDVNAATQKTVFMMDANYSDYFPSAVNSNGRGWLIDADARVINNPVEIRWGLGYLQDTNVNQLNRFRPENIDTLDLSKGAVLRLAVEERLLYIYHQRAVGSLGIYSKYIQSNSGMSELVTTDDIITKSNIYYLQGDYGLGDQPCGLIKGAGSVHYFNDPIRGDQIRRSGDGLTSLSELYYGQYFLRNLIAKYNKNILRTDGSRAKIMGFYDFLEGDFVTILQGGDFSASTLEVVENGTIQNGDINTSVTTIVSFSGQVSSSQFIFTFSGAPFVGAVVTVTLTIDGADEITVQTVIQPGQDLFALTGVIANLVNAYAAYNPITTIYLGNYGVTIENAAGTSASFTGIVTITFPVYIATFKGIPSIGDSVDSVISFVDGDDHTYSFVFQSGDETADMISFIVSAINSAGIFTAEIVTYNGYAGFTARRYSALSTEGDTTVTGSVSDTLESYAIGFNEKRNGYVGFFDYKEAEWVLQGDKTTYSWKEGNLWVHNNEEKQANFFDEQFYAKIILVFNEHNELDKTYNSLGYQSKGKIWECNKLSSFQPGENIDAIVTSYIDSQTQFQQSSRLKDFNFEVISGKTTAALLNDINSSKVALDGLYEGNYLQGNWIEIAFEYKGIDFATFFNAYLNWIVNQRNF